MTMPLKWLRRLLFLPHGDIEQQDRDLQTTQENLIRGREQVRQARRNAEAAAELNAMANEVLDKL